MAESRFGGDTASTYEAIAHRGRVEELFMKIRDNEAKIESELADFPDLQEYALKLLLKARRELAKIKPYDSSVDYVSAEHALNRANIFIGRSNKISENTKRLVPIIISAVVFYVTLVSVVFFKTDSSDINLFGVPILVFVWGCFGGVTSILLKHRSKNKRRWSFDYQWLWIVMRPLLGAIMGGFVYLAIVSGLLVFGFSLQSGSHQPHLVWGLAFIGGVSDRLWSFLINASLGPYGSSGQEETEE